ncbi:MAG: toxin FitB [Desulfonauticus sp.]|jgi:predicted nucleic acid-binding protein|nr:toxin FitB [Desulfonauticus sp.]
MKYLIDTCVLGEVIKPKPNVKVLNWLKKQKESQLYISVLTLGEIAKGIEKLKNEKRKKELHLWLVDDLRERFNGRILPINEQVAMAWGQIQGRAELRGKSMPAIDELIAATALVFNMVVVTRNISDMEESGVVLLNPWDIKTKKG